MSIPPLWLWLLAALLVWLRFPKEPRAVVVLRYILAFFVAWWAFANYVMQGHELAMADAEASGDLDRIDADTGAGAMVLFIGWLVALLYLAGAGILRLVFVRSIIKLASRRHSLDML